MSSVDDNSESQSSSATTAANRLELIIVLAESRRSVTVKKSYSLERVLSKLEDVIGFAVEIKHKGKLIEEQSAWADLVARYNASDPVELQTEREDPNKIHKEERSMLQGLVDACYLIDVQGKILFQNFAAEDLFGYDSSIIGTNIKVSVSLKRCVRVILNVSTPGADSARDSRKARHVFAVKKISPFVGCVKV